jgi:multidrug efflux pump subunit AcrA (membrane-fusion protein)
MEPSMLRRQLKGSRVMKKNKFRFVIQSAFVAVIFSLSACGGDKDDGQTAKIQRSGMDRGSSSNHGQIFAVRSAKVGNIVSLGGTVIPIKEVTLSAQLPGQVIFLGGEEGDRFTKGTKIVGLDEDELRAKRHAAVAMINNADMAVRNANIQYNKEVVSPNSQGNSMLGGMPGLSSVVTDPMRSMMGRGNPGMERYSNVVQQKTMADQAYGKFVQAKSALKALDAKLLDAKGYAPFDGVLIKKMVEIGDTVQPGTPLIKFADTRSLQIQVEVPSRLVPGLREGLVVPARLDVGNAQLEVRVAQIYPVADVMKHTVRVKFDLPPGSSAAPGMYAEVSVTDPNASTKQLPVVPVSSLIWRGSLPGVYVINDRNRRELRLVRVGDKMDEEHVSILSGLKDGERVMLSPDSTTSSSNH